MAPVVRLQHLGGPEEPWQLRACGESAAALSHVRSGAGKRTDTGCTSLATHAALSIHMLAVACSSQKHLYVAPARDAGLQPDGCRYSQEVLKRCRVSAISTTALGITLAGARGIPAPMQPLMTPALPLCQGQLALQQAQWQQVSSERPRQELYETDPASKSHS